MHITPAKYSVYKTTSRTQKRSFKTVYSEDDYGSSVSYQEEVYHDFSPNDFYWIKDNKAKPTGSQSKDCSLYYPIGPSGKYNERYASYFKEWMKNLEEVGTYNGIEFSGFDIKENDFCNILELNIHDAFKFTKPYVYSSVFALKLRKDDISLPTNTIFSVCDFSQYGTLCNVVVEDYISKRTYEIHPREVMVKKIGKIIVEKRFIPDVPDDIWV